jgi:mRNA-degrading endonuclease RelE of RelBE toxin-antitoxin system
VNKALWNVLETKSAIKDLSKMPSFVKLTYKYLIDDLKREGPRPKGWSALQLVGRNEVRIKLNREYRVLLEVHPPDLIVVKVAHRKEAYK